MISIHKHPPLVPAETLAGSAVVVIDLLRASTSICWALANGAREVWPFAEVDELLSAAAELGRENVLLGGERGGVRIDGFDLGNSPAEYTPERVAGKSVLITTTNGTRALWHARLAKQIVVGCANNRAAVAAALRDEAEVHVLCAGTDGEPSAEDELAAGAIADLLTQQAPDAPAEVARWRELVAAAEAAGRTPSEQFARALAEIKHGQTLVRLGFGDDLPRCAALDVLGVVPEFVPASGRITL
jgi:2-phosphosulfolactate phosphatase